jgi:hypothetical protein
MIDTPPSRWVASMNFGMRPAEYQWFTSSRAEPTGNYQQPGIVVFPASFPNPLGVV